MNIEELLRKYDIGDTIDMEEFNKLLKAYRKSLIKEISDNLSGMELSVDWDTFDKTGCLYFDEGGLKNLKNTLNEIYQQNHGK